MTTDDWTTMTGTPVAAPEPHGQLELTWSNKDMRLLDTLDGRYAWVPPTDWRVNEVRLLRDRDTYGEVAAPSKRAEDNLLIHGDALAALRALTDLPEFKKRYRNRVKLAYIDPPFNTGQTFEHYDDALTHSIWLTMLRDRLDQIRKLLTPDGSVWVHLDDAESHRARCVLDEVFGPSNFIAEVIWESSDSPRMDASHFSTRHNTIFVYAYDKSQFTVNRFPLDLDDLPSHYNKVAEDGTPYYLNPLRSRGNNDRREDRPNCYYGVEAPDGSLVYPVRPDGSDGCWRWHEPTFHQRNADGDVEWVDGRNGWNPYYRIYADHDGTPPETIWQHRDVGSTRTSKAEIKALFPKQSPFDTPKPEALLHRIVFLASDEGDVVLDCFAGSGTTAAVAHKMGRRWVAVEREAATFENVTVPRLRKVVDGEDGGGVSKSEEWQGGGGFRTLEVAPSMFEADGTNVWLADWAVNGQLAEATAAQLDYEYEPDGPFCGTKGRKRLAVIDGLVNRAILEVLADSLPDGQAMEVAGTAVVADARQIARSLAKGSSVRKVPSSILSTWRRTEGIGR